MDGFGAGMASQFGGAGGFMTGSQDGGGGAGGSPAAKQKNTNNPTLRAITVKQLHDGTVYTPDDQYKVDGEPLDNITMVGKILSVQEQSTNLTLVLDDGTGRVELKYWIDADMGDQLLAKKAVWQPGVFVRIHGHLRTFSGEKSVVAFNIRPVQDFNEVTYHGLQVIFQHLQITRGGAVGSGVKAEAAPTQANAGGYGAPAGGGGFSAGGGFNAGGGGDGGMTPAQQAVNDVLNQQDAQASADGVSLSEISSRLQGRFPPATVKAAAEWLAEEGHAYTGIDENHFKSTAC